MSDDWAKISVFAIHECVGCDDPTPATFVLMYQQENGDLEAFWVCEKHRDERWHEDVDDDDEIQHGGPIQ